MDMRGKEMFVKTHARRRMDELLKENMLMIDETLGQQLKDLTEKAQKSKLDETATKVVNAIMKGRPKMKKAADAGSRMYAFYMPLCMEGISLGELEHELKLRMIKMDVRVSVNETLKQGLYDVIVGW